MPIQKTITLYTFDELSDEAKETARDWWREATAGDNHFSEFPIETFKTGCAALGIEVDDVLFSGFSSQGDGACFTGTYAHNATWRDDIEEHFGGELLTKWQRYANMLLEAQQDTAGLLKAKVSHGCTRYCHANTMDVETYREDGTGERIEIFGDRHDQVKDVFIKMANGLYRDLEEAHAFEQSDENVDENIRINEYTFTETGKREDV